MPLLGVDIGGTAVKLAVVDAQGTISAAGESPVNQDGYQTPILATALKEARAFCRAHDFQPEGVGISATGQIDVQRGVVAGTCGNLPGWEGAPIVQAFSQEFGVPACVMNDVNCALMGEAWRGGAQGSRDAVMVTLGTGVGCALMLQGRIVNGRSGFAGEGGHFPTHAQGRKCTCGNLGCYEQYASVTALLRVMRQQMQDSPQNGREVFARLKKGDAAVGAAVDNWVEEIAAGLVGLVHLANPQVVLIGGGVSSQEALLIAPLRQRVLSRVMPRFGDGLRVQAAALGNSAGVLGAVHRWLDLYA